VSSPFSDGDGQDENQGADPDHAPSDGPDSSATPDSDYSDIDALLSGTLPAAPPEPVRTSSQVPLPLSKERIQAALKAEDWTFAVDTDDDILGLWDSNPFYFFVYGEAMEILQIRGRWRIDLPIEQRAEVREALDEWHFAKIWPKAYTTVDDSGRVWVHAEHSVDWEHGVTDAQLRLTLRCGITTALSLFRSLQERFGQCTPPEPEPPADGS
jgi:hypothetical protein